MTDRQAALAEAIREAIARSHADDGLPADVDIPATEAEFIEAGKSALAAGKTGPSTREAQLEAEEHGDK